MFADARIAAAARELLSRVDVPPVNLLQILTRRAKPLPARRSRLRLAGLAAAAALVAALALPAIAPGLTQSIAAQIAAILRWTPPSAPPRTLELLLSSQSGTLVAAQARVDFTIVAPAGLPPDVISERIATAPTGDYSLAAKRWSVGSRVLYFSFRRHNGRTFTLLAERVDPREAPPSKYMFEDLGERNGREVLVRHDRFTWRNGDQAMSAIAGDGISDGEIVAIREAMRGTVVPATWPPRSGRIEKQYRLPRG
jgi:hypothetical protein